MKESKKKQTLIDEDNDLGRFFELASSDKIYAISLNLHKIKKEILQDYTCDFELNGLMVIAHIEHKQISDLKKWMVLKVIQTQ